MFEQKMKRHCALVRDVFFMWLSQTRMVHSQDNIQFELIMSDDGTYITIRWKDNFLDWAKDSTANRLLSL